MQDKTTSLDMYMPSQEAIEGYKGVPEDAIERRELLIAVLRKFTAQQRAFVAAYLHHREVSPAAKQAGIADSTVKAWEDRGCNWKFAVELASYDTVVMSQHMVEQAQVKAMQTLIDLLDSKDPKVRIQAANSLAKIADASKVKQVKHTHDGEVGVNVDYKNTLMRMVEGEAIALGSEEDEIETIFRELPDSVDE